MPHSLRSHVLCSPPGSSRHGISQARILEWVAMYSSREFSWPRDQARISCIGRQVLYHWATREAQWLLQGLQIAFAPQIWSAMRCQCYYMFQGWFFQMNSALLCFPVSYLVQGGLYVTFPGDDDTSYHTDSKQGHQLRAAGKKTSAERKTAIWS